LSIKALGLALLLAAAPFQAFAEAPAETQIPYGVNAAVGKFFSHDGVRLYYEVYGKGEPLLVIHGNGGSIGTLKAQISYFSKKYMVIAMDSRDHGKSDDPVGALKFETMTDDLAALLDHLHVGPAYILGWSDGGIEALLLGIRHPEKVKMIAAMAANIFPEGLAPEVAALFTTEPPPRAPGEHPDPKEVRQERVSALDRNEPHIKPEALEAIKAPTLILASDHDAISDDHTLLIYHHIPNSQLAIFPNATHMIPYDDPELFNGTVERFFSTPFVKKDRLADLMKSYEKLESELPVEK